MEVFEITFKCHVVADSRGEAAQKARELIEVEQSQPNDISAMYIASCEVAPPAKYRGMGALIPKDLEQMIGKTAEPLTLKEFTDKAVKEVLDQKSNNTIFAVVSSTSPELRNVKFFSTKEKAMMLLKTIVKEHCHKIGIDIVEDTPERFSYLLGWEEHRVTFSIVELPIE